MKKARCTSWNRGNCTYLDQKKTIGDNDGALSLNANLGPFFVLFGPGRAQIWKIPGAHVGTEVVALIGTRKTIGGDNGAVSLNAYHISHCAGYPGVNLFATSHTVEYFSNMSIHSWCHDKPIFYLISHCFNKIYIDWQHVFFSGFNPPWLVPKMLCMIILSVTKTFHIMVLFKTIEGWKWCFWHSISITKANFELQPYLALQQDLLSEDFIGKYSCAQYL